MGEWEEIEPVYMVEGTETAKILENGQCPINAIKNKETKIMSLILHSSSLGRGKGKGKWLGLRDSVMCFCSSFLLGRVGAEIYSYEISAYNYTLVKLINEYFFISIIIGLDRQCVRR